MIKMLTAYTLEAEDAKYALKEILEQLDLGNNAKKHTAGFLFCHPDFIASGVAQSIAASLPFEVVGGTTVCNLTKGLQDLAGLTISVITSDTVEFTAASLPGCHTAEEITKVYKEATLNRSGLPSLIFPFATSAVGDIAVSVLDGLVGGKTPFFGTNAVDNTTDASQAFALHNGTTFHDGLVVLVAWGELKAKFFVSEISEDFIQKQHAVITKSEGHIIKAINDINPLNYLESIGISREQATEGVQSIPFIIDLCDGTKPFARAFNGLTPEGFIVTGGTMRENSTIAVAMLDNDDIVRLTNETLENVLASGKSKGLLLFPCVSHFWTMEATPFQIIQDKLGQLIPYQVFYSGGEICPVYDSEGKMYNRFHSFTCIACSFE